MLKTVAWIAFVLVGVALSLVVITQVPRHSSPGSKRSPLIAAKDLPTKPNQILWYVVFGRRFMATDDPSLTLRLFTNLSKPMIIPQRDPEYGYATVGDDQTSPFAIGLRDGRVLVADETRIWATPEVNREIVPLILDYRVEGHDDVSGLALAVSPTLRLGRSTWGDARIWDVDKGVWSKTDVTTLQRETINSFLEACPSLFVGQPMGAPDRASGFALKAFRVRFTRPTKVTGILVDWNPTYYLNPRTLPYYFVTRSQEQEISETIVALPKRHGEEAYVYLHVAGTDTWWHVGRVAAGTVIGHPAIQATP